MFDKINKSTQLTKCTEVLASLKPNISAEDRKKAVKEFSLSNVTVSNYLNGKSKNLVTAEKLIVFFRALIEKREKLLTGS